MRSLPSWRPVKFVAAALLAMCPFFGALAQAGSTATAPASEAPPLSIARQGYFFGGGHLFPANGDQAMAGQMFVQSQAPAGATRRYPVVMIHGGGQTGTNFLGTPDGRPGWNDWFLRQGYSVYVVDQPARGRSAYYPAAQGANAPSLAHGTEQRFTAPERYNPGSASTGTPPTAGSARAGSPDAWPPAAISAFGSCR